MPAKVTRVVVQLENRRRLVVSGRRVQLQRWTPPLGWHAAPAPLTDAELASAISVAARQLALVCPQPPPPKPRDLTHHGCGPYGGKPDPLGGKFTGD